MSALKSDRSGDDGFSNAAESEERNRINARRSLERMGLMSFDRPWRNPYWDLNILGLMRVPQREDRMMIRPSTEARPASKESRQAPWPEESPRSSEDHEPLLL
ncbi:hypothetical protein [Singulisphaera acidiphila]|uniref:Uncharacterized protein n=1 Tax=Singulisphaera acidiphila (strain ATCC BAA-1392 / DSM 18658 / VKM B-2454 / MOB10) TaxID=886293 RepID=L0DDU7_SINAD|nr:hypothetical protein [Singulisphaera acidiphila]AGA27407.1 hypothetical protein Sinac_3134 [Singulisphaera acidiphila DSM 18658]